MGRRADLVDPRKPERRRAQPRSTALCARHERRYTFDLRLVGSLQPGARHLKKIPADYADALRRDAAGELSSCSSDRKADFTPAEIALCALARLRSLTLGPIILRVETAAIYCLSILSYELLGNVRPPFGNKNTLSRQRTLATQIQVFPRPAWQEFTFGAALRASLIALSKKAPGLTQALSKILLGDRLTSAPLAAVAASPPPPPPP